MSHTHGVTYDRDQGVLMCMNSAGVQQREPSVLHEIVHAVSGVQGASHSSSSLASVPGRDKGEKPFVKSICLMPHSGPCSCGERDWALEHHRVAGVPPLAETRGRLKAGVHSSTSTRGVAAILCWCRGWRSLVCRRGGGSSLLPWGSVAAWLGGGGVEVPPSLPCLFRGP